MRLRIRLFVAVMLCLRMVGAAGPVAAAPAAGRAQYTVSDLGTLPGGSFSQAYAINSRGWVVGQSSTAAGEYHAFVWQPSSGMQDLGLVSPGCLAAVASVAYAIDDQSRVLGTSDFRCLAPGGRPDGTGFLWQTSTGLQALPISEAFDLNNLGRIVGAKRVNFGFTNAPTFHAAAGDVGQGTAFQDLGTLPGLDSSLARGLNGRGQVVGWSWRTGNSPPLNPVPDRAFLWQASTGMQDLGTLAGADASEAYAINDAGEVVGTSSGRAFLWQASTGLQDLGTLSGASGAAAYAINRSGQVVGQSGSHAYVWGAGRGMQDLGALPSDIESAARGINDQGSIVGSSTTAGGQTHAVLWQPAGP